MLRIVSRIFFPRQKEYTNLYHIASASSIAHPPIQDLPSDASSLNKVVEQSKAPQVLGHHIITELCLTSIVENKAFYEIPILHLKDRRNNVVATLTDCNGRILSTTSCGVEGFVNARKKTTVAAQTVGISIGLKARKLGINAVRVKFRGLGNNRLPVLSGVNISGIKMVSLTDDTNVHYGLGRRPRKPPRK